ncbi:competence type IV pilus assembly protein ComGB [Bacillus alkalicellulosilyticus]|uniref:competence type IV pilus assembly protein ComGB n=1 Tax=Alkalihalobacterium alkalicellulosilyticum TaxID=1912214 RepID=UPI0014837F2C|nr:competence type IV pilus assembly protein ComGB [Bacillus alkalicellulosilyticus]
MKRKWKDIEKAEFLKKLGTLLEQGYTLAEGIELLSVYTSEHIQVHLRLLLGDLREGIPLHQALEYLSFPQDVLLYLFFAEKYGELGQGLKEAGELFVKRVIVIAKFNNLLRYPLLLLWIVGTLTVVMVHYLFPHFQQLFESMSVEPPLVTIWFLTFIDVVPQLLLGGGCLLFVFVVYYFLRFRHLSPHKKLGLIRKIPFVSSFLQALITFYFTTQLSGLLKGGVPILHALSIFENQQYIRFFQDEAISIKEQLHQGIALDVVIAEKPHYQPEFPFVIKHGQSRGKLDSELRHYGDLLFENIEERVKKALMILQPLCFCIVGGMVLVMFLSILLPIFQMINSMS